MPKDDFYTPTDIDALRMENELLTFEVRFLRAQSVEVQQSKKRSERARAQLEDQLKEAKSSLARLEGVERDFISLLRRLANSPFSWYFLRNDEIRTLKQRYLGTDI